MIEKDPPNDESSPAVLLRAMVECLTGVNDFDIEDIKTALEKSQLSPSFAIELIRGRSKLQSLITTTIRTENRVLADLILESLSDEDFLRPGQRHQLSLLASRIS